MLVRESCGGRGGGQDSTQELRRQLWGLVGFGEALGGRLHVGGPGRFGDWECRQTEANLFPEDGWF